MVITVIAGMVTMEMEMAITSLCNVIFLGLGIQAVE